ncbi:MAG: hypothetical protein RIB45_12500 [Marivibrio sp.]|uniref:hypothetical protein n=1 Tax=Marivibrio sp. TaxID=2039719 RepID=UPI0032ED6FCC
MTAPSATPSRPAVAAARAVATPDDWYRAFAAYLHETPAWAQLGRLFPMPEGAADGLQRHRHLLSQAVLNPSLEAAIPRAIGAFARDALGAPPRPQTADSQAAAAEIEQRGWTVLPDTPREAVERLRGRLEALPLYAKAGAARSAALDYQAAQAYNVAEYRAEDALAIPDVLDFVCEPTALAAAERYLAGPPMLLALVAWWSFPGHQARDAQLFHLDVDDHRFVKHFVYLTDVDGESGPHAYVEGTHRPEDYALMIKRAGDRAGQQRIYDWLFQTLRKSDADVEAVTGKRPTLIEGAAGTRFLAMTRGLHKGVPPASRPRLLLQATYGVSPAGVAPRRAVSAETAAGLSPENRRLLWLFGGETG